MCITVHIVQPQWVTAPREPHYLVGTKRARSRRASTVTQNLRFGQSEQASPGLDSKSPFGPDSEWCFRQVTQTCSFAIRWAVTQHPYSRSVSCDAWALAHMSSDLNPHGDAMPRPPWKISEQWLLVVVVVLGNERSTVHAKL